MIGINPNHPERTTSNHWNRWWMFHVLSLPFPTRRERTRRLPFIWLFDLFIATILWLVGCTMAEYFDVLLKALIGVDMYGPLAIIGWFPLGMWMHYCTVGFSNLTYRRASILIIVLGLYGELLQIEGSWIRLPFGLAILAITLPLEFLLCKIVFSLLPGSCTSKVRYKS